MSKISAQDTEGKSDADRIIEAIRHLEASFNGEVQVSIEDPIQTRIIQSLPKFLRALSQSYPLAVLTSLCIAITAFTAQSYPQVQLYSITAACLFLISFISSFISKIVKFFAGSVVITYAATGLAVSMFIPMLYELALAVRRIDRDFSIVIELFLITVLIVIPFTDGFRIHRRAKSKYSTWGYIGNLMMMIGGFILFAIVTIGFFDLSFINWGYYGWILVGVSIFESAGVILSTISVLPFIKEQRLRSRQTPMK